MDMPAAESLDDPPRVNTPENYPMSESGRQVLLVESGQVAPKVL